MKTEKKDTAIAKQSFEQSMAELDTIVTQMENGNLPLEEMIAAYRRGALLIRHCRQKLSAAQMEIKQLEQEDLIPFNNDDNH